MRHHVSRLLARVLAVYVAGAVLAACGGEAPPRAGATPLDAEVPAPTVVVPAAPPRAIATSANPRSLGDPNAPVKVMAYSDFQCPFCASFVRDTEPQIVRDYIDTGKVYYEFHDLPLYSIHPGALLAAHVANCAAAQGRFWPMYARLFQGQDAGEWHAGGQGDFATFLQYAAALQLDMEQFDQCVRTNQFRGQIEQDVNAAIGHGLQSTPSFTINGQPFIGAQPYGLWQEQLDAALAASK